MKDLQNWWQLSAIQIGAVICLPVIMIGQTLSQSYGFTSALVAILIGNFILLLLGLVTVKMSYENRKTTILNAEEYFGGQGIFFFALTLMFSLVAWFGIQLNMMSLSIIDLLSIHESKEGWLLFFSIGLGLLMTSLALNGIRAVSLLANVALPFLLLTLAYALYTVDSKNVSQTPLPFTLGGTSLVIALAIAFVTDLPTYYRHAKTSRDGIVSIALIFVFALPILEVVGVYLARGNPEGDILSVLKRSDGHVWNIWVAIFLVLAGWTTNNTNLYSAAISFQSIFKNASQKVATLVIGIVGTVCSCFDLLQHLELVLDLIGIFIASMGAVILTRYMSAKYFGLKISSKDYSWNFLAWIIGIFFGFMSMSGFSFTSIALLDAVLGGSLGSILILSRKELYEKA